MTVKLVKIRDGLYRTESGSHHIMRNLDDDRKELRWVVSFTNFFNCKVKRKFQTLAECRIYISES